MSDNTKLNEARQVVKKQLLRKLMQQAVDEIGAADEASLEQLVGSVKSEIDFSELQSKIKPLLKGELEKDLMRGLSGVEEKLSGQLKGILSKRALEKASDSIDPEFLSRISDRVLEDHHGRISDQIESDLAVRIDRTAHGAIRTLLTEKRDELQDRILGSIKEETLDAIRSSVEGSIADTISGQIEKEGTGRIEAELRESIQASIVERAVEGISESIDEEMLNRIITQAVSPHRDSLVGRIRQELEAEVRREAAAAADEFANGDASNLNRIASGLLSQDARQSISDRIRHSLSDSVAEGIRAEGLDKIEAVVLEKVSEDARRAVRELLSEDGEEFMSRISGSLDEAELDAVMDRVKATVTNGLAQQIQENGLDDVQKSLNEEVSMLLGRRAMEHARRTVDDDYLNSMSENAVVQFGDAISEAVRNRIDVELDARTRDAVRGLLSEDGQQFSSRVSGSLDESEMDAIAERIRTTVTDGLARQIRENGLDDLQQSVNRDVRDLIGRQAIEHAHETIGDDYLEDVSSDALGAYTKRIEDRVRAGLESGVAKEARKAVDALLSSGDNEILTRITEVMDPSEIEGLRDRLVSLLSDSMAGGIREQGLDRIQANVNDQLASKVEEDALSFLRTSVDEDTLSNLSEKVLGEFRGEIAEHMRRQLDAIARDESRKAVDEESFAAEVSSAVQRDEDLLERALGRVNEMLVEHVAQVSISRLDDVESVAQAARDHVSFDNDTLIAAMAMLRTRIMQDIARRTTKSLGNTEDVAADAREWVNEEDPHIEEAASNVERLALETVRVLARKKISDTAQMAARVAPEFDAESEPVRNAVEETRALVLDRIEELAAERIARTDETALEASSRIEDDHESVQKAVSAAVSMLMDDVVRLTEWRLSWTEKVAAEARGRMDDEPADVSKAAAELERMLVGEVAESAMTRVANIESTASEAGRLIDTDNEVLLRAVDTLRDDLVGDVAREAVESLSDTEGVAGEARGSIDPAHAHIASAVQRLRRLLMGEIADGAVRSIEDADKTANDSRRLIGQHPDAVQHSQDRLYDMLLQEIGRSVLEQFTHADEAAAEAMKRIDSDEETLVRARTVLRRRLVERLLADALSTLGDEVSPETDDSERTFFRTALRQVMGRPENTEEGGVPHRFRDRGPAPLKAHVPGRPSKKKETARSEQSDPPSSGSPAFRIQDTDDMNGPTDVNARGSNGPMITEPGWTILSEMDDSSETRPENGRTTTTSQAERTWSVTEFKPSDNEASSGDGVVADVDGDPDFAVYGALTDEYTYRMSVRPEQLRKEIQNRGGDLTDLLGEYHPAGRVDGDSIEASAEALLEHATNVLMLRLSAAGRPVKTENRSLDTGWLSEDEVVVASGSMVVATEMEDAFRFAARAADEDFDSFGISVQLED